MPDILSHAKRKNKIYILTLDEVLARDVFERITSDNRLKSFKVIRPGKWRPKEGVEAIETLALSTLTSKLLVIDVRRLTLAMLQHAYNKVVGYNRRDLNQFCYTVLIGDGPANLFHAGKALEVFVPHLSSHRVDYNPAVYFYDPFIHYEPHEIPLKGVDDEFQLPSKLPERFRPYFQQQDSVTIADVRRYFRAEGKSDDEKNKRASLLKDLCEKRIAEQFPNHKDKLYAWLSKDGIQIASERMHLYPFYFEDWVYELLQKAG